MKCGVRVALGVAGGYFLGRTKKMKLALMLGGMAAGRQAGGPAALLEQGKNLLNTSPELSRLSDELKGRLFEAGKGAALAVATRQIEALTDRVAGRVASSLGDVAAPAQPSRKKDADDEVDEGYDSEEEADEDREPAVVGGRSEADEESAAEAAPARPRARAESATRPARSAKGAARTATRRTGGPASGGKRTADKTGGRSTRTRRDDSG